MAMKKITALFLALCLVFSTACGENVENSTNLMKDIKPQKIEIKADEDTTKPLVDFSAKLFGQVTEEGKNTLISPVSILYALAMTANGAKGETLAEIEKTVGTDINSLNHSLAEYMLYLGEDETSVANSIWYRNGFEADRNFLQTNADFFGADIYTAPFDDSTVKDINGYVNDNTKGMIDRIIHRIEPQTAMILINALTFEAQWREKYKNSQINEGEFTAYDGSVQNAEYMYSTENVYLSDENTKGFIKYYKDADYAFVALLPDEDISIDDYTDSLSGEKLCSLLQGRQVAEVDVAIPRFESEFSAQLNDVLADMGINRLFDPYTADLSGMGKTDANLFVSSVLHKTYISVDKQGTKAAAVTLVATNESAAAPQEYIVRLDRPFVYMIVHGRSLLPVFIGTTVSIEK
ncbi:MAG: serpin family protein [Oscillospiraceae bacterium]|nr:serpin family protein [Oscillospiraceae bacterium]